MKDGAGLEGRTHDLQNTSRTAHPTDLEGQTTFSGLTLLLHNSIWVTAWQNQQNDLCTQWRLRSAWASAQSDQSSLLAQWIAKDVRLLHVPSEDSDQTGWMPRLILVFAGYTGDFVGVVNSGSITKYFFQLLVSLLVCSGLTSLSTIFQ